MGGWDEGRKGKDQNLCEISCHVPSLIVNMSLTGLIEQPPLNVNGS